nr:pentapeptide repeat-containing protein [Vibrio vulnificus]
MKYQGQHFHREDFSNQDLQQAIFDHCHFIECNFDRADLTDSQFIHCRFIEASSIEGCSFRYTKLREASFKHCMMAMAQFTGTDCFGIEFRECDLKGANFSQANFSNRIIPNQLEDAGLRT